MAGVFGLRKVYIQQVSNTQGDDALELNIPGLNWGYIAGGYRPPNPGMLSSIERLDFGTETFSSPGNLVRQGSAFQCVSSENYGYFMGGQTPDAASFSSDISRLDFSNETSVDLGDIPSPAGGARSIGSGGMQTPAYGYISGGGGTVCTITRIEFSTETVALNSAGSMSIKGQSAGTVYSPSYGYIGSRFEVPPGPTGYRSVVDRFDFSVETCASLGNIARNTTNYWAYQSQSTGKGYFGGGYLLGTGSDCKIDRIDFATDTFTQAATSFPRTNQANQDNGIGTDDFGYLCGGFSGGSRVSTVDRFEFATETGSTNSSTLSTGTRQAGGGVSAIRPQVFKFVPGNNVWKEEPNYGYSIGGYFGLPNAYKSTIIRLEYGTETATISPATDVAPVVRTGAAGVYNANYGYAAGGQPGGNISSVSRLEFSTETMQRSTANLTQGRARLAGASDTNYGYTGGGQLGSPDSATSTMDKLDFSNETVSANPGKLNQARIYLAGTQSDSYGYFGAGRTGPSSGETCTIERLDFSNGTVSNPPASTTYAGQNMSAFASATNAYFFCGRTPISTTCTISRLDFGTDTSSDNPGQLSQARYDGAGVSNFGFGYVIGGDAPPGSTIIDRVDFTTDTVSSPGNIPGDGLRIKSATVNGGVSTRRVGKATYGYAAGGVAQPPGSEISTIDRFEFLTETVTNPSVIGKLSRLVQGQASFSSSEYGYFGGGYTPAVPGVTCLIDRLDFSNDTASQHSSSFQTNRLGAAGIQNANYGYAGGGQVPAVSCTIARLDFSTETVAQPNSYSMTRANRSHAAISGPSYGYFAGGLDSGGSRVCLIDRFDFTTETGDNPAFSLPTAVRGPGGTQNTNDGYFAGGDTPTAISNIFRLDFTTETLTTNPNNLSSAKSLLPGSSSGDGRYGYFYGGYNLISTIDRIEFDSGTVSTPSQKLTSAKYGPGSVANG